MMLTAILSSWSIAIIFNSVVLGFVCFARSLVTLSNWRHVWWQMLFLIGMSCVYTAYRELGLVYASIMYRAELVSATIPFHAITARLLITIIELGSIRAMTQERCGEKGWLWSFACCFFVFSVALWWWLARIAMH